MNGQQIIKLVADEWGITPAALVGQSRRRRYAWPRHVAIALIRHYLGYSLTRIGHLIGGRDHTTIRASLETIRMLTDHDPDAAVRIARLRAVLDAATFGAAAHLSPTLAEEMVEAVTSATKAALVAYATNQPDAFLVLVGGLVQASREAS